MGHVGKAQTHVDPLTGRMDYFGLMVNRAAKISFLIFVPVFVSSVSFHIPNNKRAETLTFYVSLVILSLFFLFNL
jgi:hypothetical protein